MPQKPDVTDAHLRILAEQAEDRIERAKAAEALAGQIARAHTTVRSNKKSTIPPGSQRK